MDSVDAVMFMTAAGPSSPVDSIMRMTDSESLRMDEEGTPWPVEEAEKRLGLEHGLGQIGDIRALNFDGNGGAEEEKRPPIDFTHFWIPTLPGTRPRADVSRGRRPSNERSKPLSFLRSRLRPSRSLSSSASFMEHADKTGIRLLKHEKAENEYSCSLPSSESSVRRNIHKPCPATPEPPLRLLWCSECDRTTLVDDAQKAK